MSLFLHFYPHLPPFLCLFITFVHFSTFFLIPVFLSLSLSFISQAPSELMPVLRLPISEISRRNWGTSIESWRPRVMGRDREKSSRFKPYNLKRCMHGLAELALIYIKQYKSSDNTYSKFIKGFCTCCSKPQTGSRRGLGNRRARVLIPRASSYTDYMSLYYTKGYWD